MAQILEMEEKRRQLAARKGFQSWSRRFGEPFDENTLPGDLSDSTLSALIQPGEGSSTSISEVIMGIKGLGLGPRFHFLETPEKMDVMDITLFLLDQFRFEAMKRLGWVDDYLTSQVPLLDMVVQFPSRFVQVRHQAPALSRNHPRYAEYEATFEGDRNAFIRRLIPEVLEAFKERTQGKR